MRLENRLVIAIELALMIFCAEAQHADTSIFPRVFLPETELRYLYSSIVGDEFEIFIALPRDYNISDTTYPVLYLTDANMWFAATTQIMRFLQLPGKDELPQILLVGIGYNAENISKWMELRARDLTPTKLPDSRMKVSGGADRLLRFIREELMPFVQQNYRASPDASYCGGSFGGLFGLFTLFHEPETFQRYIIISPSIWYDNRIPLKYEREYALQHSDLNAKIFMSVGSFEQSADSSSGMITDMFQLADSLRSRGYSNMSLETALFDGETHRSVISAAISRGLRVIYK